MVRQIDNPRGGDAPKVVMLDWIERDVELVDPSTPSNALSSLTYQMPVHWTLTSEIIIRTRLL